MKNQITSLILFLLSSLTMLIAQEAKDVPKYLDTELDFEARALDLVDRMTLDEKISQIGHESDSIPRFGIAEYNWWNECLHGVAGAGVATVFPQSIGMGASFDPDLMLEVANAISTEARAKHHEFVRNKDYGRLKGLTFWSPNINIFRDPRWGRGHETYGEDPYLTGQMGMPFVKGLQGDDDKYFKVVSTAKHYAVHNGPEAERHYFNAVPNARDLWETYLPAFYDLMVTANAYSIMGAYNRVDGESASASWLLLEDILRDKWGFEGFVVSDCGAIWNIFDDHKIVNSAEEAAALGIRRGCDLNCGSVYRKYLKKAINDGLVGESEVDVSVYRLMLARMKLGMFDPPEMVKYAQIPYEKNNSKAHNELALKMSQKSMTLLKNNGILPLNKNKIKEIAVIGPNATSEDVLLGNYNGLPSNPVNVLKGIQNAVGKKVNITYAKGCPLVTENAIGGIYQVVDSDYLSTKDENGNDVAGVKAEYFRGVDFKDKPALVRVEKVINHGWRNEGPTDTEVARGIITEGNKIEGDYYSVRWTGTLTAPETGMFKIGVVANDGAKFFIDEKLILETWSEYNPKPALEEINLEKGKTYKIKIDYVEKKGEAIAHFIWETPSGRKTRDSGKSFQVSDDDIKLVEKADVAVFVAGLDAHWEGEELSERVGIEGFFKGDRTKIELPKIQIETIRRLQETGTPVILVLMAGSAMTFDGLENELPAILEAWYPGQRGGDAIASVLFGDYNPSGRLPVTFYKSTEDLADFRDYNMKAGNGQTYRYFKKEPLYPFGHGLSYTTFEYSNVEVNKTELSKNDTLKVSVDIKNTGAKNGEEVVQLYVKDLKSNKVMPIKQLRAFKRTAIKKGKTETIEFTLSVSNDFRYYDAFHKEYMVEAGDFEIQIGASSKDIRQRRTVTVK